MKANLLKKKGGELAGHKVCVDPVTSTLTTNHVTTCMLADTAI